MAVISTKYVPLNSDQYEQTPEEQQAAYEEATANLQNTLLTDGIDLSGLSDLSSMDLFNPYAMRDEWDSNPDHFMNSEHMRSGGGMDNAYNSGYMGHSYVGDDGRRYRKIVSYDEANDQMVEQYTDERMYRWSPSDEHKRTGRDEDVLNAATGQEYKGSGGTGWYTEEEIRGAWDAGDMHQMQEQGVSWDQYWGYVTGVDELITAGVIDYKMSKEDSAAILQGEKEADNWMDIPEYRALVEGLGIPLKFGDRGDVYNFNGFGYSRDYWSDKSDAGPIIKTLAGAAIAAVAGPAVAGGLGFTGGVAGGVANGVIGSAIGQGVTTGKIDTGSLVTAGILGGLDGWFADMATGGDVIMDGGIITEYTDKAIWDMSDFLGVDYETASGILEGIVGGAVTGGSLEEIVAGAVAGWGGEKVNMWLEDYFGNSGVDVSNWFREGETTIPTDALGELAEGVFDAALSGGMSESDALSMLFGYFNEGGSLDFIWPEGVDFGWLEGKGIDWPNVSLPDWLKGLPGFKIPGIDVDFPDVDLPDIPNPCGEGLLWDADLGECIPDINAPEIPNPCGEGLIWDADLGECIPDINAPEIPNPCGEGLIWDADLGECVPELPDAVECMEGWEWDDLLGECVEIEVPDAVECMEGWEWDDLLGECVEIEVPDVIECVEGFEWDDILGKCVEIPDVGVECPEGWDVDEDGVCIEPPKPCSEGYSWDPDLGECIPDREPCPEGQERNAFGVCVDPKTPECGPGYKRDSETGECVKVDVDLPNPDLPDAGMLSGGGFNPSWSPLQWNNPQYLGPKGTSLSSYQTIINSLKSDKGMFS